jgi:hypothetical protein
MLMLTMEGFIEFVMVYEHTVSKFKKFIDFIVSTNLPDEWSKEYLDDEWIYSQVEIWIDKYFDRKTDNFGEKLTSDLIKIVRHIAQDNLHSAPPYYSFEQREIYDLDKIAEKLIDFTARKKNEYLSKEFSNPDLLWKTFYTSLNRFETAIDAAIRRIFHKPDPEPDPIIVPPLKRELTEEEKEKVKKRDAYICLCCGVNDKLGKLQIDHIKPFSMGGETSIENSQTLCKICNRCKNNNEIDFRCNLTKLKVAKNLDLPNLDVSAIYANQTIITILTRIVNLFYHCKAVETVRWEISFTLDIHLYPGNNPQWLLKHKAELLNFIKNKIGYRRVEKIQVIVSNKIYI